MTKSRLKSRVVFTLLAVLMAVVLSIAIGLPSIFASAASVPYSYMEEADGRYVSDHADLTEAHSAGRELNKQIMEESIALLKNENGTLPFNRDVKNISVFGKHSVDFSHISRSNPRQALDTKRASLQDSLREAGYNINPVLENFYRFYDYPEFEFSHPKFVNEVKLRAMAANNSPYGALQSFKNPIKVTSDQYKASVLQPKISEFDDFNITNSMKLYNDAALIVLGNRGSSNFMYSRGATDSPTVTNPSGTNPYTFTQPGIASTLAAYSDPSDYDNQLFELTKSERDMIDYAADRFDNVVVLMNSAESWDIPELKEHPGVDSVLHMAIPGTDGILALGKILNGEVNPSGRTVNMHLADTKVSPQWQNQGTGSHLNADAAQTITFTHEKFDTESLIDQNIFHEYEEGIYIGSKYFETRGWEMGGKTGTATYTDGDGNELPYADGDWDWYDDNVVYPLGHGLSYTDFKWDFAEGNSHVNDGTLVKDDVIKLKVKVTNTGNVAGKDVVQLYYTAPYTSGGVEKAFVNLKGFEKTKILNPGQSQILTLELQARDMASYDWNNASGEGKNDHNTWGQYVLESGDYQIRLMRNSNVRTQQLQLELNVPTTYTYDTDRDSGNLVENHFTVNDDTTGKAVRLTAGLTGSKELRHDKGIYNTFGDYTTVFTRADFGAADLETNAALSFPKAPDTTTRKASDAIYQQLTTVFNPTDTDEGDVLTRPWMKELSAAGGIPANWTQAPVGTTGTAAIQIKDMAGVSFDNAEWDAFLNQLTLAELYSGQIAGGAYSNGANARIGLPRGAAPDGAHGLQGAAGDHGTSGEVSSGRGTVHAEPTAITMTWNKDLMYRNGRQMGTEARLAKANNLYTLTFDLRRQHYEARTWEGCSEEPFLIGTRGMQYVRGSQDAGTIVQIKHFALFNGGVRGASPTSKLLTEQALRELYLEPFRMGASPKLGGAMGIMTAYNRIGIVSAATNYSLLTRLTKNEWGFAGWIVTDMQGSHATQNYNNGHLQLRAGMDQFMGTVNANVAPIWDPALRGEKGGVKLTDINSSETYAGISGNPESAIQYYRIRQGAKRILYAAANSNILSYSDYLYKDATSAWGSTGNISAVQNIAPNIDLALSDAGTLLNKGSTVTYRLAEGSTLPLGTELTSLGTLRQSTTEGGDQLSTVVDDKASGASGGAVLRESSTKPFTFEVEMLIDNQVHAKKQFSLTMNSAFQLGTYDAASTDVRPEITDAVSMSTPYTNLKVGTAFNGRIQGVSDNVFYVEDAEATWQNAQGAGRNTVYSVESGSFPAGLTLNNDGTVTGTPIVAGQYDFTIKAHRMIRTVVRDAIKTENIVYYIHSTMVVAPDFDQTDVEGWITSALNGNVNKDVINALIDANSNGYLTAASVQSIINASISGTLNETTIKAIVDTAVAGRLTEAEVQTLIDDAIAAKDSGCNGSITSFGSIAILVVLLGAAVIFVVRRKKSAGK